MVAFCDKLLISSIMASQTRLAVETPISLLMGGGGRSVLLFTLHSF